MTYESLMQLAIDARLGAGASHPAVVDLLYTNVVGIAAMRTGTFRRPAGSRRIHGGGLGVMAADIDINRNNIDLVGLSQQGLEFVLYAGG